MARTPWQSLDGSDWILHKEIVLDAKRLSETLNGDPLPLVPSGGVDTVVVPMATMVRVEEGTVPFQTGTKININLAGNLVFESDEIDALDLVYTPNTHKMWYSQCRQTPLNVEATGADQAVWGSVDAYAINAGGVMYEVGDVIQLAGGTAKATVKAVGPHDGAVTAMTLAVGHGGTGYADGDEFTLTTGFTGTPPKGKVVTQVAGVVTVVEILVPGTGAVLAEYATVHTTGGGDDALRVEVTAVDGVARPVTELVLDSNSGGYTPSTVATTIDTAIGDGDGTGLTVDISSVNNANGKVTVEAWYVVRDAAGVSGAGGGA